MDFRLYDAPNKIGGLSFIKQGNIGHSIRIYDIELKKMRIEYLRLIILI